MHLEDKTITDEKDHYVTVQARKWAQGPLAGEDRGSSKLNNIESDRLTRSGTTLIRVIRVICVFLADTESVA